MEPFSAAANGLAVISIAFQLTETCIKLYRFWDSVEDAPTEIAAIKEDLQYLISVFKRVESNENALEYSTAEGVYHCRVKIAELTSIIEKFDVGFQSLSRKTRAWTAFKAATHSKHVQRFRESLNETKVTLMIALVHESVVHARASRLLTSANVTESLHRQPVGQKRHVLAMNDVNASVQLHRDSSSPEEREPCPRLPTINDLLSKNKLMHFKRAGPERLAPKFQIHQLMLETIAQTAIQTFEPTSLEIFAQDSYIINGCGQLQSKTLAYAEKLRHRVCHHASTFRTALGRVWVRTTTLFPIGDPEDTTEKPQTVTFVAFYPTAWLQYFGARKGFEAVVASVNRSWQFNFRLTLTSAVPDDSLIFDLCRTGQTRAVELLLSKRLASVGDTNPDGWKPLHFAAAAGHVDLCAMLIRAGADKSALVYKGPSEFILSPISLFVACSTGLHAEVKIAMLRLFWDCIDLASPDSDGWQVHDWLKRAYARERVPLSQNSITWLLTLTAHEEYVECGPRNIWSALQHAVRSILNHERHSRYLERILELSEDECKNVSQQHVDALGYYVALRVGAQVLIPMVIQVGSFLQMKGFDWIEEYHNMPHQEYLRAQPNIYAAWCHAVLDGVKNLECHMRQELDACSRQLGWTRPELLDALSGITPTCTSDLQLLQQQTCTRCKCHYGALDCMLVEPARITALECAKNDHYPECVCQYLRETSKPPADIPDYIGVCYGDQDGYISDPDEEFFDALPHIFDTTPVQTQRTTDMFSNIATLLYSAQGRTWISEYTLGERLCATCLLVREQYIGEDGLVAEFPPMPKSFEAVRVNRSRNSPASGSSIDLPV